MFSIPFIKFELPGKSFSGFFFYVYLVGVLLFPLLCLGMAFVQVNWSDALSYIQEARVLSAIRVTFWTAFVAALINLFFGVIIAWVQVRYRYFGRMWWDMIIDLPFALPTAVTGIVLTAMFSAQHPVGAFLERMGIHVNYTPLGILLAMVFVGIPFVVRQVEPVLHDLGYEMEQAARMLGASPIHIFYRVILPNIIPAALGGFTATFARGLSEYGSIIFISGNMPFKTEVVSLLIVTQLEQFNYDHAVILAVLMLSVSLFLLLVSNRIQAHIARGYGMEISES